ncbi:MAG: helix-turn-helix transcriptional regulator [Candidatus Falkowbacteria bacterium]
MNKTNKATDFQKYLEEQLKDKELKKIYDEYGKQLEIAYQILQLRKKQKITQLELAKKIGTTQSNVARMESGQQNFTIDILSKVAAAFNKNLKVSIS